MKRKKLTNRELEKLEDKLYKRHTDILLRAIVPNKSIPVEGQWD